MISGCVRYYILVDLWGVFWYYMLIFGLCLVAKKVKEKLEKFFEFTLSFFLSDVEFLIFFKLLTWLSLIVINHFFMRNDMSTIILQQILKVTSCYFFF